MALNNIFQKRYSCRNYKNKAISEKKLKNILKAVQLAPSARNQQPYKFIIVEKKELKEKLAKVAGQTFIAEAYIIIAGVSLSPTDKMSCNVPTYPVDLGIAMEHIALQAAEEELGTCWIGAFKQEKVKEILNIPKDYKVATLMPLGYPADSKSKKERKELKELVCYNNFK